MLAPDYKASKYMKQKSQWNEGKGTSLVVQCLRLCAPKAGGAGLIPDQGTKIPRAVHCSKKKKKRQYTILIGVRRYILLIVVCIALMTSDVEDLLMHLLVICLSLEKCFFRSSGNFFSIDLCEFFIYLDINPLIWNMLCKHFLPFFYTGDFYGTWIIYIWIKLL